MLELSIDYLYFVDTAFSGILLRYIYVQKIILFLLQNTTKSCELHISGLFAGSLQGILKVKKNIKY